MSLRRAVGSLLTRRFSPRPTPVTPPARPLHSWRDPPLRDAAGVAAAAFAAGVGALALQYFREDPAVDEQAALKNEEDLKARFEDWAKKYDRTYRDAEEKAMRFQVFKDTIKWIESQPPDTRDMLRPLNCFADMKSGELCTGSSMVDLDPDTIEYNKKLNEWLARNDKGERFFWPPELQAEKDKQATQASA